MTNEPYDKSSLTDSKLLHALATALFGASGRSPFAATLKIDESSVRHWLRMGN